MEDKRKNKRTQLTSRLIAKKLRRGETDSDVEELGEVVIHITDVSKRGVGFLCAKELEIGSVYEAELTIWTKEKIHTFLEIVRMTKDEEIFSYGGVFIGMTAADEARIEIYQTVEESEKNQI